MKAVFDTKPASGYDDDLSQHYQFPRRYLSIVNQCIGDWVVLRRPRANGGNLAYFATARVLGVEPDLKYASLSYARFGDYLAFDRPVSWLVNGRYAEEALRNMPQRQVGVYLRGRSVRFLSDDDFAQLIAAGFSVTLDPGNAERLGLPTAEIADIATHIQLAPPEERARRIEQVLINRVIREANFRNAVCDAYDGRCAMMRTRIVDRNGNFEAQGAHIWAVADGGPDVVQNGIALSATVHWLFDRHLISLADDYRLLVAERMVPSELRALFAQHGARISLPANNADWPHPAYMARHREKFLFLDSKYSLSPKIPAS